MRKAIEIALFFLHRVDREVGDTISPKKLQKLLYYGQAWSLMLRNQPLFVDELEAWVHGPVVRSVWEEYRTYRYQSIPKPEIASPEFSGDETEVLDYVWGRYGDMSANQLEQLTHSELPWLTARRGLGDRERSNEVIDLEKLREFHATEGAWGKFPVQEQVLFQALVYELLCRPEEFGTTLSPDLVGLKNAMLDVIERENPNYNLGLKNALIGAFVVDQPAMTSDEFGEWFAAI